jgi:hypothetical protein
MPQASRRHSATVRSFNRIFGVSEDHRLVQVRSRSRAGVLMADYWSHCEYDADNRLIARYESFDEWNPKTGLHRSGWDKYDDAGRLIASGESLEVHEN